MSTDIRLDCTHLDVADESAWAEIAANWTVRNDTTYMNHGSFGLPPNAVKEVRSALIDQLNANPMDFFDRKLEGLINSTLSELAAFVGTTRENIVFVDNATYGMNVVADSFPLLSGDEILLNEHEYGAVHRIWHRACDRVGARVVNAKFPKRFESKQQIIDALFAAVTNQTRMIVVSHITSPTAITLPIAEICQRASENDIAVCIDGPHAIAQIDVNIDELNCDFYTASCHKWLCATLGSGFLYAHPRWHNMMEPLNKSWGRLLPALPEKWFDEFTWSGTRDISGFLSVAAAIEFFKTLGLSAFRNRSHYLAQYARHVLEEQFGTTGIIPNDSSWYVSMAHVPLPENSTGYASLQNRLWQNYGIEVPIIEFDHNWYIRVSNHLYNSTTQIDYLAESLQTCLT